MSQYSYSPLRSEHDSIRLLRLLPNEDDAAEIQCELFEYPLHESRKNHLYEALSYVWGDPKHTLPISMHGHSFNVTVNLHAALLRLRNHFMHRILWIDAICINQANQKEKEHQIQAMAKIYGQANRVVVWLGEAVDESDKAFEYIRIAGGHSVSRALSDVLLETKVIEKPVVALLQRPWFRRIWVLQEVGAARQVLIICGSAEIDGHAFCSGVGSLHEIYEAQPDLHPSIASVTYLIMGATFRPHGPQRHSPGICTLGELLDMYHSHEASLQHDKIYALLGLSSDAMNDTSLSPNYDLDWKKLFETLVGFVLYKGIQVGPSPNKEHTLIRGAAYILGSVRSAEFDHRANGEQDVQVEWRNVKDTTKYAWMSCNFWTLRPSTKPVLTGDVICLFREASQPIIIRICKDDCFVIRIAPTPPSGISFATNRRDLGATPMEWSKFEEMAQLLPARSIQCIWDWGTLPERLQKEREFEKSKVDSRVVSGILNSVLILGEAGAHDEAVREFQELMWAYETSCENDPLRDTVAFEIGQKKDFIMCYMKEHFGKAPLSWAAEEGYKAVVDLLIRYDEGSLNFVDRMGHAPLTSAVKGGHLDVIERLLLEKLDINISAFARMDYVGTALQGAAYWGRIDIVERLLQEGADVNSEAAPYCGRTALQAASECDHFEIVERLLKAKADVNAAAAEEGGLTALQAAARMGHSTIVELLLQEGADVDAEAAPSGGMTALQAAAWAGHTVIVERLLKEKAKVNGTAARDWGTTALRAAVKRGHVTIVDRLLQEGAYLNAMDKDGMTALLLAAQRSSVEIVERLLQEGADVNAKDNYGRTALGIATEEGHQAIVERLREAGAE